VYKSYYVLCQLRDVLRRVHVITNTVIVHPLIHGAWKTASNISINRGGTTEPSQYICTLCKYSYRNTNTNPTQLQSTHILYPQNITCGQGTVVDKRLQDSDSTYLVWNELAELMRGGIEDVEDDVAELNVHLIRRGSEFQLCAC
jgi:hypothetical protein